MELPEVGELTLQGVAGGRITVPVSIGSVLMIDLEKIEVTLLLFGFALIDLI